MKTSEIFHNVQVAITSLLQALIDFCIAERAINQVAYLVLLQTVKRTHDNQVLNYHNKINVLFLLCPLACQNCAKLSTTAVSNRTAAILLQTLLLTQLCVLPCNSQQLYTQRTSPALIAQRPESY